MGVIVPVYTYGIIRDYGGNPQAGATVNISGSTGAAADSYATTTTDSNGKYQLNIQDYVNDGDTVKVIASYESDTTNTTYTLTLGDLPEEVNLQFTPEAAAGVTTTRLYKRTDENKRICFVTPDSGRRTVTIIS